MTCFKCYPWHRGNINQYYSFSNDDVSHSNNINISNVIKSFFFFFLSTFWLWLKCKKIKTNNLSKLIGRIILKTKIFIYRIWEKKEISSTIFKSLMFPISVILAVNILRKIFNLYQENIYYKKSNIFILSQNDCRQNIDFVILQKFPAPIFFSILFSSYS